MRGRLRIYAGLIIVVFALSACGQTKFPDVVEQDTIVVNDDGSITSYLVRDFDKDYYELSELTVMAREEASEYNKQNGADSVTARAVELMEDGNPRVRVVYDYTSYIHYNGINEGNIFYGTVAEAFSELPGTELDGALDFSNVTGIKNSDAADTDKLADRHVIITDEKLMIYCPQSAVYLSEGAVSGEDGGIDATQAEGYVIIILKK
ncbi:MAG: hypothetical protein LUG83_04660 [Lachnospiraceae bacterium]|nr:hypothetical protein [Lachnospiraceae bacterium]